MIIRGFNNKDFNPVLQLLNTNCEWDTFSADLLYEKLYQDPIWNPKTTLVATTDNQIIGFIQGVTRLIRGTIYGFIKLMAVNEPQRRQGIGSALFQNLENRFIDMGVEIFKIYDVPLNYFMPGIDPRYTPAICFAQKMGFQHTGDAINMTVDLNDRNWNPQTQIDKLKNENIEISRATVADKQELYDFIVTEWPLWQNELEMAYTSDPVAIYIARKNGKIKAFSAYNGNNVGTGWFGPMGTHSDVRGKGVGNTLLYLCLNDIKKSGLTHAIIPWVAPIGFYAHYANAKISRVFWRFEKKLLNP